MSKAVIGMILRGRIKDAFIYMTLKAKVITIVTLVLVFYWLFLSGDDAAKNQTQSVIDYSSTVETVAPESAEVEEETVEGGEVIEAEPDDSGEVEEVEEAPEPEIDVEVSDEAAE